MKLPDRLSPNASHLRFPSPLVGEGWDEGAKGVTARAPHLRSSPARGEEDCRIASLAA